MDDKNRFDGKGEIYAKARPKYAASLFAYLRDSLSAIPGCSFADVGSGTGIFTGQLLDCGYRAFSSSYSLKESAPRYLEYCRALNELFDRFSTDGKISLPNETIA